MPLKRTGPLALTNALTTNVYNPPGPEETRLVHVVNKTDSPASFSLWIGASAANAAGTEWFSKVIVGPRAFMAYPYTVKLTATDFIVGGSDTSAALTITLVTSQVAV